MNNDSRKPNALPADVAISEEELAEVSRQAKAAKAEREANKTPRIKVNGVGIALSDIDKEMQYHPSATVMEAKENAARALVIRELLIQRAIQLGLSKDRPSVKEEEDIIEKLLEQEIDVPEVTAEACKRYYENNKKKFRTSPLYEVSHILIPAPPNQRLERRKACDKARSLIKELNKEPGKFELFAKEYSACSTAEEGGHMGQVSHGQTTANFEKALFKMEKGEISAEPVETSFGYHILKVHNKVDGKNLAYDDVKDWVARFLTQTTWSRAVSQYIQLLAAEAEIEGYTLKAADSPLVQ